MYLFYVCVTNIFGNKFNYFICAFHIVLFFITITIIKRISCDPFLSTNNQFSFHNKSTNLPISLAQLVNIHRSYQLIRRGLWDTLYACTWQTRQDSFFACGHIWSPWTVCYQPWEPAGSQRTTWGSHPHSWEVWRQLIQAPRQVSSPALQPVWVREPRWTYSQT